MDNELIRLKKDVTLDEITGAIWCAIKPWHSLISKQSFVNVMVEKLLPVIEEKGGG